MSLTSYRAAPPRVNWRRDDRERRTDSVRLSASNEEEEEAFRTTYDGSTAVLRLLISVLCGPGDDLLSHVLRQSTIGAKAFDGRVRDGIGSFHLARATRPAKDGRRRTDGGGSEDGFRPLPRVCRR
jgi:hypothetical protein